MKLSISTTNTLFEKPVLPKPKKDAHFPRFIIHIETQLYKFSLQQFRVKHNKIIQFVIDNRKIGVDKTFQYQITNILYVV